ncbi:hypothetical protein ACAF76_005985 [Brevibacillus sp. TJ4]|uniref:hypothetical protein n=1 Tax=Brevibacillus sp. TJ4 TaxID=3234853 RepID=UPI0037CF1FCD
MNCQEFRSGWLDETDSDQLSHMETCEACIAWLESQSLGDEEVQFLKEIPSPPAHLEDRIMEAIYQTAGQVTPPHAATATLPPATGTVEKRRFRSMPYAWVSAAAVLLVTGIFGYQQLQGPGVQTAQESGTASGMNQPEAANHLLTFDESTAAEAGEPPTAQSKKAPTQSADNAATEQTGELAAAGNEAAAMTDASALPEQADASVAAHEGNGEQQPETSAAEDAEPAVKEERPMIVSRNADKPATQEKPPEEAAVAATQPDESPDSTGEASIAAAVVSEQSVFALTAPEGEMNAAASAAEGDSAIVGPPAPNGKPAITVSTFQDVDTAVQSSNMPVPVLNQLPDSFVLSSISVRYESETSQNVEALFSHYVRGQDWIRIDVERNKNGNRSLSIPGTFTATQLFSINNEQAIGVTYEQKPNASEQHAAQHAVHFNAQSNGHSLYVVITAYGVSLEELIETSKQISWKP